MIEVVVEFEAAALSLSEPPACVDLTLRAGMGSCAVTARAERDENVEPIAKWLDGSGATRVERIERRVLSAHLAHVPPICTAFTPVGGVREVRLRPGANGRALLHGDRVELLPVVGRLRETGMVLGVCRVARAAADVPLLTGGQFEALSLAAQSGYYEIPRPLNLHDLADRMGASTAALSERLRRAEARVIVHYLRHEEGLLAGPRDVLK